MSTDAQLPPTGLTDDQIDHVLATTLEEFAAPTRGMYNWADVNPDIARNSKLRRMFARAAIEAYRTSREGEAVAVVCDTYELRWIGSGPIAPIVQRHGIKVGAKLYTHPADQTQAEQAAMLDYLEKDLGETVVHFGESWYWRKGYREPIRKAKSLRDAIRAAIKGDAS